MYDFLRSPRWIVSHVLILVLIVSMIGLGFWQRARWLEQSAQKDRIESRSVGRPVPLDKVVGRVTDPDKVAESVDYQRVTVTGRYDTANEVAIRNRSLNTAPGVWVLTPLVQADGTAIAVVRGWVPIDAANPKLPFPGATPPSGQVTVTGVVQRTEERGAIGPTDPATGHLDSLARVDLGRLAKQYRTPLEPVWMLLDTQAAAPAQGAAGQGHARHPVAVAEPVLHGPVVDLHPDRHRRVPVDHPSGRSQQGEPRRPPQR